MVIKMDFQDLMTLLLSIFLIIVLPALFTAAIFIILNLILSPVGFWQTTVYIILSIVLDIIVLAFYFTFLMIYVEVA